MTAVHTLISAVGINRYHVHFDLEVKGSSSTCRDQADRCRRRIEYACVRASRSLPGNNAIVTGTYLARRASVPGINAAQEVAGVGGTIAASCLCLALGLVCMRRKEPISKPGS